MICSLCTRYSLLFIVALSTVACQPPTARNTQTAATNDDAINIPVVIDNESVTMTQDDILTIKSSRYQPSLGLQGRIEPMEQARFIAANVLTVKQVLVTHNQRVEKDAPLFIVRRSSVNHLPKNNPITSIQENNEQLTSTEIPTADSEDSSSDANKSPQSNHHDRSNSNLENIDIETTSADNTNIDIKSTNPNRQNRTARTNAHPNTKDLLPLITVRAPFSGYVDALHIAAAQQVDKQQALLHLSNDADLRFIATLPLNAKSQLSIGQTVNFTAAGMIETFTGQVSKIVRSNFANELLVYVTVVKNEVSRGTLTTGMMVTGRVDYGQIEVGAIVPKSALHDVDLTELQKQPYQPLIPLSAHVWIIQQDQRLTRQRVEVISFDPSTVQYLIAGINNDSLICLTDFPLTAVGKKVVIS